MAKQADGSQKPLGCHLVSTAGMQKQKIAIIGAGLAGITTAYELARRGKEVTVYEMREGIARETSFANGSMLTSAMSDPWNAPGIHRHLAASLFDPRSPMKLRLRAVPSLFIWGLRFLRNSTPARHKAATTASYRLGCYSVERTRELRELLNLQYDAASRGSMKLFRDPQAMESSLAAARLLAPIGLRFELLDRDGAVASEPELASIRAQIAGAVRFPDDESGDALKFCEALGQCIAQQGGRVLTRAPVATIAIERGKAVGVMVADDLHRTDVVVVAAGNATPRLLRPLGLSLPIKPVKGYTVTFDISHLQHRPQIPIIDDASHAAVVPLGTRLRMAGTAEFAGMDTTLSPERIDILLGLLAGIYPQIAAQIDHARGQAWTALRPMSADGLPFIGPTRVPGLLVNAGHGHLGWTLAVGSAHLLADLIAGHRLAIDPAPFSAMR